MCQYWSKLHTCSHVSDRPYVEMCHPGFIANIVCKDIGTDEEPRPSYFPCYKCIKAEARAETLERMAQERAAVLAAEAAREQGKYWEFASLMFQNQNELGVSKLKEYATRLGLDRKRFDESLDSGKFAAQVQKDMQEGLRIGVNSTPSVYVNGMMIKDRTKEGLKAAVETALKSKGISRASN